MGNINCCYAEGSFFDSLFKVAQGDVALWLHQVDSTKGTLLP